MHCHSHPASRIGVGVCPNGCICLQFGYAMVHLSPSQFRELSEVIALTREAMDRSAAAPELEDHQN